MISESVECNDNSNSYGSTIEPSTTCLPFQSLIHSFNFENWSRKLIKIK